MRLLIRNFCTCLLLCSVFALKAQSTGIGKFYDHLPYNKGGVVCLVNDKVYVGAGQTLFTFDLSDNSIETFSKVNKLSDLGINALEYSPKHNSVIIGYTTGNIDVIANNQVINIPDIERTSVQGFKSINNILIEDDFAFLSTGFGIVKLDIQRKEIKETYLIGDNASNVFINDLAIFKDTIYAATNEGIYFANENNNNLSNFQNWDKLNRHTNQVINQIEASDSSLIYNLATPDYNKDTLFSYTNNTWEKFLYDGYGNFDLININFDGDDWLFSHTYAGVIVSKALDKATNIYNYDFDNPKSSKPREIIKGSNDEYWIADEFYGLVRRNSTWSFDIFTPTGPAHYEAWDLEFSDDALWVAPGSLTSLLGNRYQKKGVYKYANRTWESFDGGGYDSLYDITSVTINPLNSSDVYFGSWGVGLIKTTDGIVEQVFDDSNSGVQSLNLFKKYQIGSSTFDDNGVLWVTCSGSPGAGVNNPLVAFDGANWYEYNMDNKLVNNTHAGKLFVDVNGYKWFSSRDNGVFIFDDNGTLSDDTDDRIALITTGESTGNLPTKMVHTIAEDQDGKIWIGTEEGLTVINSTFGLFDGEVKADRIIIEQEGSFQYLLETEIITSIKVDGGNRKWIGTNTGGVYLVSEDGQETIHHFTAENSALVSNTIFDIEIFGTTGEVFFATDRGIVSYMGDATDGDAYNGPTYAYPNPVRPDYDGLIGIKGLAENAEVKITDITGNVVYETMSEGTTATWTGKSLNGNRVQTGVYIVFSVNDDGTQKEVAKILFIN